MGHKLVLLAVYIGAASILIVLNAAIVKEMFGGLSMMFNAAKSAVNTIPNALHGASQFKNDVNNLKGGSNGKAGSNGASGSNGIGGANGKSFGAPGAGSKIQGLGAAAAAGAMTAAGRSMSTNPNLGSGQNASSLAAMVPRKKTGPAPAAINPAGEYKAGPTWHGNNKLKTPTAGASFKDKDEAKQEGLDKKLDDINNAMEKHPTFKSVDMREASELKSEQQESNYIERLAKGAKEDKIAAELNNGATPADALKAGEREETLVKQDAKEFLGNCKSVYRGLDDTSKSSVESAALDNNKTMAGLQSSFNNASKGIDHYTAKRMNEGERNRYDREMAEFKASPEYKEFNRDPSTSKNFTVQERPAFPTGFKEGSGRADVLSHDQARELFNNHFDGFGIMNKTEKENTIAEARRLVNITNKVYSRTTDGSKNYVSDFSGRSDSEKRNDLMEAAFVISGYNNASEKVMSSINSSMSMHHSPTAQRIFNNDPTLTAQNPYMQVMFNVGKVINEHPGYTEAQAFKASLAMTEGNILNKKFNPK